MDMTEKQRIVFDALAERGEWASAQNLDIPGVRVGTALSGLFQKGYIERTRAISSGRLGGFVYRAIRR